MSLYKNKYRIEPARLVGYDYGSNGAYHITICTKGRLHHFGEIVEKDYNPSSVEDKESPLQKTISLSPKPPISNDLIKMDCHQSLQPTKIGIIATENWLDIPNHFSFVLIDSFVIMPNHIHGILIINKLDNECFSDDQTNDQSHNISSIIRAFKGSVKRYANTNNIAFEWQERFHDRIIRDSKELDNTRLYIYNNPANWMNDELKN